MDGFKARLKDSIQMRLSVWLSAAILAVGLIGGGISFGLAFDEAGELQDDLLRQIASMFDRHHLPVTPSLGRSIQPAERNDSTVIIQSIGTVLGAPIDRKRLPFPSELKDGIQTVELGKVTYRVLVRTLSTGERMAFAQETEFRDDISTDSAVRTLMPSLILIPVLLFVIADLVKKQFQPISVLAAEIDHRREGELHPVSPDAVPLEVRPFVVAINDLLRRVALAMDSQRRFIADAAHELRSPLTALSLQTERLEAAEMPDQARSLLLPLRRGIDRGRALLDQLLTYARIQSTVMPPKTLLSLQDVYRRVLEDLLPLAKAKNIDIGIKAGTDAAIEANQVELSIVIKNLVANAISYTPRDGRVDLWVEERPGEVVLLVEDTGPGIPESDRARAFDPFYRVLGTEQTGSGIGLAIVKTIIERLGGAVEFAASSISPTGLRVCVRLPNAKPKARESSD